VADVKPRLEMTMTVTGKGGKTQDIKLLARIDTLDEIEYFRNGGILQYVLRNMVA